MLAASTLLIAALALPGLAADGVIRGTVVNTSTGKRLPCMTEVVLRVRSDGQFVPCRDMVSDADGRFQFDHLPAGSGLVYQVGANRHGVHYPGPRVPLTAERPAAMVELSVCDAVAGPNPLVIRRMEIDITPEPGVLRVTESLVVDNPSSTCFVGESSSPSAEPVTLRLNIPSDFERTTFDEEFLGRRFAIQDGGLVTGIPWPPGRREVKYTYTLKNAETFRCWDRPLDLPCHEVQLRVHASNPKEVSCNLPGRPEVSEGQIVFRSDAEVLPAGHRLRVELGHLPLPWITYAKWLALVLLAGLMLAATAIMLRRRRRPTYSSRSK